MLAVMLVTSLADLKQIQREIAVRAEREAQRQAELARQAQQASSDKDLFVRAAGAVQPLADKRQAQLRRPPPPPLPVQRQRDEQAVLVEALSDEFDASTLLDTD